MKIQTFIVSLLFVLLSNFTVAETYTWTDDQGKVHFGDTVPPKYKDAAKPLKLKPLNVSKPEERVRLQNQALADRLRREDGQKKTQTNQSATNKPSTNDTFRITKEYCRDLNLTVKLRTECFRKAAEQEQRAN